MPSKEEERNEVEKKKEEEERHGQKKKHSFSRKCQIIKPLFHSHSIKTTMYYLYIFVITPPPTHTHTHTHTVVVFALLGERRGVGFGGGGVNWELRFTYPFCTAHSDFVSREKIRGIIQEVLDTARDSRSAQTGHDRTLSPSYAGWC